MAGLTLVLPAEPGGSERCMEQHHRDYPIARAQQSQQAVAAALIPVPLGWWLVYGVLGLVRWVRQGFRPVRT